VDANGVPLGAPANRHDSPLLERTLDATEVLGGLPERMSVHLDRGYDSKTTRERLRDRGFLAEISEKGKLAPIAATGRWSGRTRGAMRTKSSCGAPSG
jgi:IS5 family transposase